MAKIFYNWLFMTLLSQQDALTWLTHLPSESVDLVVTDPPYSSLEKHRSTGTTTRLKNSKSSSNIWFDVIPNDAFQPIFKEIYRILKPNSHFYLFCDQETMFAIKPFAEAAGFKFWKPLIWDKCAIGMGYHYRARYEFILFFEKGKRKLNNLGIADVLPFKRVWRGYPTEKPVDLLKILIEQSTQPDDIVIDPFFGSGSTLIAAKSLNRKYWGNDISDEAHHHFQMRLNQFTDKENNTAEPMN